MSYADRRVVLGGGVTGLAVAATSGAHVIEAADGPGGLCRSYYLCTGENAPRSTPPADGSAYRFEVGGGHWIFGGDTATWRHLESLVPFRAYRRRASVWLPELGRAVPYPLQGHLEALGPQLAAAARRDLAAAETAHQESGPAAGGGSLGDWLASSFGPTLSHLFFTPFHDRYTAGLTRSIAPQDGYKTPSASGRGYNASFRYPVGGLDRLAAALAPRAAVHYGRTVTAIDTRARCITFADGSDRGYDQLVSSLPLHAAISLTALPLDTQPDPHTSVLVLNIGATRGPRCPSDHWQYEPASDAGFHRLGFYSNVDQEFLPAQSRNGTHVSLYVERAFRADVRLGPAELAAYDRAVVAELQRREYIGEVEVLHRSWVDVAYTWRTPGSAWREQALATLSGAGVQQVGRYGRWRFQGIAESVAEGLAAGLQLP